jgi:hypothetical protein
MLLILNIYFPQVMTNIGPAKPQRITSPTNEIEISSDKHPPADSSERSCLLLNGVPSPSSPKANTPPHKLCLETSFTSLSPDQCLPTKPCVSPSSNGATPIAATLTSPFSLHPTISWEYASMLEEQLTNMNKNGNNGNNTNNKEITKIDLIHDDWFGLAPLATPESLSEVSSISSRTSSLLHGLAQHYPMLFSPRMGKRIGPVVYKPSCLQQTNTTKPLLPLTNSSSGGSSSNYFDTTPVITTMNHNREEIESSLNDSIDLSFESATSTPTHQKTLFNNNIIVDVHETKCFQNSRLLNSPKQVTFNLNNNNNSIPPSPQSLASTTLYFVHGTSPLEGSPEEEDSGIGTVSSTAGGGRNNNNVKGYRPLKSTPSPCVRKRNSVEEISEDVSPLPLLSNIGESPNYEFDFNHSNGESSV